MKIAWLPIEKRKKVIDILNQLLSDEFVIYIKTLNFHWNLKGPHFNHMHKFFEQQYEDLLEMSDRVAERVRALDGTAFGSMAEFLKHTRLDEAAPKPPELKIMVKELLHDHDFVIGMLRKNIVECERTYQDTITSNFLQDLCYKHEKMAWTLRASLE